MPEDARSTRGWTDVYTLLCERCGYVVEGLPEDGPCPECGVKVDESQPKRRTGTPWQICRGFVPTAATALLVITQPRRTLDRMRIQPPRVALVLIAAALPIGCLLGAALVLVFEMERPLPGGGSTAWSPGSYFGAWMLALVIGAVLTPMVASVLWGLTWVEARGLVIFGKQNKFRIPPDLAHTIVRHGAFGWLLCGVGAALTLPLAFAFETEWRMAHGPPGRPAYWLAYVGLGMAILGFLAFEVFAWLGLRRCKFANRERPGSTDQEPSNEG